MTREEADEALARLRDERDRISAGLLDLDAQPGRRMLDGAAMSGASAELQARVADRMARLWLLFDRYRQALSAAEELRERHARPKSPELAELTRLLDGRSVELEPEHVPLEKRGLLGGPGPERLTLEATVRRMTALYGEVAQDIAAVDAAWTALLPALETAESRHREAAALAAALEASTTEVNRLGREVAEAGHVVRSDPLSLMRKGGPDTSALTRLANGLGEVAARLEEALRLREGYAGRLDATESLVDEVRRAHEAALRAHAEALEKIASPGLSEPSDLAGALADRLAALRSLPSTGRWDELAERLSDLERAAADARARAQRDRELATGLLERREELRGRLAAYRVKAARLGLAEDAELLTIHERARELLWTSPCDLRAATVALSGYQQAVNSRAKGTDR
ncbi:hypothetical protein [Actinomadura harenae]|uniref:Uncharacterized protein n=1 Tax=Actinomadura harenae TaxID=2483351 RepID=A0A3M2MAK8_9ACTN|nr:hypothetical protein [Actinomadura harenae]RMI44168.1 hypothetical protein EBO15_13490 [Actinomadura harenae]